METKPTSHVIKGLIISLILIIIGVVIYVTGQMMNKGLSYISYAVLIGGLIIGNIMYAKQLDGNTTFGNIFAHGFKTTAVVIVIMAIWMVLSVKLIFPGMVDQVVEASRKELEKSGKLDDSQIEQALGITRKFFLPLGIGGVILGYAILGAIGSLLGAAFAKKNPQAATPFNN